MQGCTIISIGACSKAQRGRRHLKARFKGETWLARMTRGYES